ncbi:mitogen-activated protein kinase kinase kinase NPK1-like [Olea europaea var. sylvestris]|uniref:mitogen-activated protein kinase kinase kinase NPK1-like n=1 Tax=Olea europaea var. sylvestris TaxID=158386 RepID=UPI000C1D45A3|nr:mitogen-activated protein kinase kinase kinase NPK1-like [Olea europaea var. sylvestris]
MGDKWKKTKFLGAGSYGTIYLASKVDSPLSDSIRVAVKSAPCEDSTSLKEEGRILYELRGCREIVQCFGEDISFENNEGVYSLLLEYASGGSLNNLIDKYEGNMPESLVACYSYMLLKGLSHVHEEGFVHCDLKPTNILVFPSQDGTEVHNLKIADFGAAKKIGEEEILTPGTDSFHRGTIFYASPESIASGLHIPASDIWSLGCIIVEMIVGKPLWTGRRKDLIKKICFGDIKIPEKISGITRHFLKMCLAKEHQKRWTANMLLDHPFIVKNLAALPPNFNDRVMLSLTNPFGRGTWVSTYDLFSTQSEPEEPADLGLVWNSLISC